MAITDLSKFTSNCRACGKPLAALRVFYGAVYHPECTAGRDEDGAMRRTRPRIGDYIEWTGPIDYNVLQIGQKYRFEGWITQNSFCITFDGKVVQNNGGMEWFWNDIQFRIVPPPAETKFPQQNIEDANMRDDAPLMVGDWVEWVRPPRRALRRGERYQVREVIPKSTSRFQSFYLWHPDVMMHNTLWCFTDDFRRVAPGKPPGPPKDLTWAEARFVGLILE